MIDSWKARYCFIKCTYGPGMFDNEYAVEIRPGDEAESLSLFADKSLIAGLAESGSGFLRVQLLARGEGYVTVALPQVALETDRSIVRLRAHLASEDLVCTG